MEEAAAAAVPAPDSSISRRSRPAGPVRVVAAICPGGKGGGSFQVADSSAGVSLLPLQEDRTPRPGYATLDPSLTSQGLVVSPHSIT
jgi:kinesin family member 22